MSGDQVHVHPQKVELFDVDAGTNTDPKGFVRRVDEYRVEAYGLYMAREVVGHPRIAYVRSWLLPALGLRANELRHHPGHEREWDTYLDVATITRDRGVWRTVDHYLDVVLRGGRGLEVLDADELSAALVAGLIEARTAERAMRTAFTTVEGLAAHGYDLAAWLAGHGIALR